MKKLTVRILVLAVFLTGLLALSFISPLRVRAALMELPVVAATASSEAFPAIHAFDGIYDNYWHVTPADGTFPKWLQADFGSPQNVVRVEIYNSRSATYDILLATDFAIWVGDNPAFPAGSYTEAAHITGNTVVNRVVDFASPVTGRYLRYVVYGVAHPELTYATAMYEMDIFTDDVLATPTPVTSTPTPSPALPVVAAVASSVGTQAMNAFDDNTSTFWQIASDNFGYADKWVQADLGNTKAINNVELNFGLSANTVATDFKVWIGDDPSFALGNYIEVASVTGNTLHEVSLAIEPVVNGRWVRLIIIAAASPSLGDFQVTEMRIHGSDGPSTAESKYAVGSATASSTRDGLFPINAFDGNYNDFWHVSSESSPKWVQADLGGEKWVSRAVMYEYGGIGLTNKIIKHVDFQIWVGEDVTFTPGTYAVVATVTGNDDYIIQRSFTPAAGRYVRFVITAKEGPSYDYNCLYEMEIWGTGDAAAVNHTPIAQNQSVSVLRNTPQPITLSATDLDGNPLTYSVVSGPTHGLLNGTAPTLTYTPDTDYLGPDSFTFRSYDGEFYSNIATVGLNVLEDTTPLPLLPVVAAAASSANNTGDGISGNWPMRAFDGQAATYWQITQDNFGYPDKWVLADLGNSKTINQIAVNFGLNATTVATAFTVWIGDDPSFTPGHYTEVANVSGNTLSEVALHFSATSGRWVRLTIGAVAGPNWSDFQVYEMRIYGADLAPLESKYSVGSATASSYNDLTRTAPLNAFNGNYNDFWHVSGSDASSPKWVQADLGGEKWVSRAVIYEYGGVGLVDNFVQRIDFQIWVGDDINFTAGSYTVVDTVVGNDAYIAQRSFTPTAGRYVRFVLTHIQGPASYYNCLYEMEIWGSGDAPAVNHAPVAQNQSLYLNQNTPRTITLSATDLDGNPLTYSVVSGPTHGLLNGTAPALAYTPAADYLGADSFTFKVNDGLRDSNIATVSINIIHQNPYVQAVSLTNLYGVAAHLVEDYGPRRVDVYSIYTDNACTLSTVVYSKSNMERADDYLKAIYESWGYQVTLEEVNTGYGVPAHNVVATKIGSVYPNIFIDVGGHLDTQPTTPGAGDNASGSTAVVEIARVLKDYPSRYSLRFINDVGHETCGNCGMAEHVRLLLERGEQIKAGLMMDGIGWSIIPGVNNNEVWWNSLAPGTERIVDMFGPVRSMYGIDINFNKMHQPYAGGDGQPYLDQHLPAIMSIGGTPYNAPGYHNCPDTMAALDMQNILKTTQQNLAVMLLLDQEYESNLPPVAVNDIYNTDKDVALNVATPGVLGNDSDSDSGTIAAVKVSDPVHGALSLNLDGSFTYTPNSAYTGDDTFTYQANDGTSNSNIATVMIRVGSITPPPVLPNHFYGEIHIGDPVLTVGDVVQVTVPGIAAPFTTAIAQLGSTLIYAVDVSGDVSGTPDKEGGAEGDTVTFRIHGRIVATGIWHGGTNTQLDFHSTSLTLQPGWNLVSFNLHPASTAIAEVLSGVAANVDLAYAWDAAGSRWLRYDNVAMNSDTLAHVDETMGVWLHLTGLQPQTLAVYGSLPTTTDISLVTGWNLVGYPSVATQAMPGAMGEVPFSLVYGYQAADPDAWKLYDPTAPAWTNDLTALSPGWGYWIQTGATQTWTVNYLNP